MSVLAEIILCIAIGTGIFSIAHLAVAGLDIILSRRIKK